MIDNSTLNSEHNWEDLSMYSTEKSTNIHFSITISKSREVRFSQMFHRRFANKNHEFRCVNLFGRSWRTREVDWITPTYIPWVKVADLTYVQYVRDTILSHSPTAWLHTPDWTQSQELPENVKDVDRRIINRLTYMNLRSEVLSYHRHTHTHTGCLQNTFLFLFWVLTSDCKSVLCEIWNPWLYEGFPWQLTGFIYMHSHDTPWLDFDMAEAQVTSCRSTVNSKEFYSSS
jgi:hypothetical protein